MIIFTALGVFVLFLIVLMMVYIWAEANATVEDPAVSALIMAMVAAAIITALIVPPKFEEAKNDEPKIKVEKNIE